MSHMAKQLMIMLPFKQTTCCLVKNKADKKPLKQVILLFYLFLAEDEQALWFDGMIGSQIFSAPSFHTILEGFPNTIASRPGHTDVMPLSIVDQERQLCDLLWSLNTLNMSTLAPQMFILHVISK